MIKIKNIYYMLSYAYQSLNETEYKSLHSEQFENIHDLMSAILIRGTSNQIKRGLHKNYRSHTEETGNLRGKIDSTASIKQNTFLKRRMVCHFDEFSENTLFNQILKTTMLLLLRHGKVKVTNQKELRKLMLFFGNVGTIDPQSIRWSSLNYHRHNAAYKMLMNICELVIKGLLISTENGEYKMKQFLDDQQMHRLYEKFLLGYYQKEYPQYSAKASYIDWVIDDGIIDFLPAMKSDITLTHGPRTLIIDAKYYGRSMQTNSLYNNSTIISSNLYQIYTYVKNKDRHGSGNVSGLLLYAKTDEDITPDNDYQMGGNRVSVKTLDLSGNWVEIKEQLDLIGEMMWTK
ncbi:5-methylcytosine-specific restriction endonuclease system specificity protein McrC [Mesobacillus sp. AQ2]|uniref:5-methylcytosine-specific restriction endonuclease system specificity protein McrC n=1 Tax=Mesobacillus sp. AQ2 TaxID=3043332 RepID=UPI0024C20340|nr:5-methylcytosine-specific restriction endonuclease system specificity protein McrC [Mesobacillus sp. AQ2]WHX41199.1 5-methylcytosine-specific restriction endonuclease system specificity protein McrC [Mesobacillus sp. AQ2]